MGTDWEWVLEIDVKGGRGSGHWGHAGRPGQRGGSAPGRMGGSGRVNPAYFNTGPGRRIIEGLHPWYQKRVVQVMMQANVQPRHVARLERVTTDPCLDFGNTWEESDAHGVYDPETKTIHLNPALADFNNAFRNVISHELGHHVTMESAWMQQHGPGNRANIAAMNTAYIQMKKDRTSMASEAFKTKLASVGLRSYSLTNAWEWRADSWKVYQYGSEQQKRALADYHGVDSLDDIFGG